MQPNPASNATVSSKAKLVQHLQFFLEGKISTETFCDNFEQSFNFELDKTILNSKESKLFSELFNKVIWYSPFPEERRKIKNYLGDPEILAAAHATFSELQTK